MTFITAFCFLILFENYKNKDTLLFRILKVGFVIISFIIVFYDFFKIYDDVYHAKWFLFTSVAVSGVIVYFMWKLAQTIPQEKLPQYAKFGFKFIIYIAIIFVLNQAVKYVWGRPRFIDLITNLTLEDYRAFWQPNFFSGYKSFYSGHTTAICSILPLIYVIENSNYNGKIKALAKVSIIALIIVTMFSRLIAGDHFLTDVSFAFLICTCISACIFKKTKIKQ